MENCYKNKVKNDIYSTAGHKDIERPPRIPDCTKNGRADIVDKRKNQATHKEPYVSYRLSKEVSRGLEQFQHLETIEQKLGTLLTSEVFSQSGEAQLAKLEAQNGKLDNIERALNRIIEIVSKKSVAAPAHFADSGLFDNQQKDMKVSVKLPIPKWFAYTTCGVVIAAGLAAIAFIIIKLFAA